MAAPNPYRRILMTFVASAVGGTLLFWAQGRAQMGWLDISSASLCGLAQDKIDKARKAGSPKMLVIGGSGTIYGFNAQTMEHELGVKVRNFGLQAALGPRVTLEFAKSALEPGDTALLSFEPTAYDYDFPSDLAIRTMLGCQQKTLADLGPVSANLVYVGLSPFNWLGIFDYRSQALNYPHNVDDFGDRPMTAFDPLTKAELARLNLYQPVQVNFSDALDGPDSIRQFVDWARQRDIRVLATWPNTIAFPSYGQAPWVDQITAFYRDLSVPMIGTFDLALYPRELFYDTQYHMNAKGIEIRTRDFIAAFERWRTEQKNG